MKHFCELLQITPRIFIRILLFIYKFSLDINITETAELFESVVKISINHIPFHKVFIW